MKTLLAFVGIGFIMSLMGMSAFISESGKYGDQAFALGGLVVGSFGIFCFTVGTIAIGVVLGHNTLDSQKKIS